MSTVICDRCGDGHDPKNSGIEGCYPPLNFRTENKIGRGHTLSYLCPDCTNTLVEATGQDLEPSYRDEDARLVWVFYLGGEEPPDDMEETKERMRRDHFRTETNALIRNLKNER